MSWSHFFPVIDPPELNVVAETSSWLDSFEIAQHINSKALRHLVVTSLYCGENCDSAVDRSPLPQGSPARENRHLGCYGRRAVMSIARAAKRLRTSMPHIAVRVYLDRDLDFLIEELLDADCEVILMKATSKGCCRGSMWRFLALKERALLLTVLDAEELAYAESHVQRTEAANRAGLGGWRVPRSSEVTDLRTGVGHYRPIKACFFGSRGGFPIEMLVDSTIRSSEVSHYDDTSRSEDDFVTGPIGIEWPKSGFDEWFLLAAIYPQMASFGILTFFPQEGSPICHSLLMDVEYCTWANQNSELVLFRSPAPVASGISAVESPSLTVQIRSDCTILCRSRRKARRVTNDETFGLEKIIPNAVVAEGSALDMISLANATVTDEWWSDLDRFLVPTGLTAELFLDRRIDEVDLAVSGWFFIRLDEATATWAVSKGAAQQKWRYDQVIKVPNLESPMTLWRTSSSRAFAEQWVHDGRKVRFEVLLALLIDLEDLRFAEVQPAGQGWEAK